jgi:hypothetical protein
LFPRCANTNVNIHSTAPIQVNNEYHTTTFHELKTFFLLRYFVGIGDLTDPFHLLPMNDFHSFCPE